MPDYEFCRNMDQEMIANRVRNLKSDELSALVENVIVMIDCGQFPHEAFHEVNWTQKLLWELQAENTIIAEDENETFN